MSMAAIRTLAMCALFIAALFVSGAGAAGPELQSTERTKALKALLKAVEINDGMKETYQDMSPEDFQVMVDNFKKFNDEVLWPSLDDTIKILGKQNDPQLAEALLALAISYTNFDDDRVFFALGEVYLENPDLMADAIAAYDRQWQGYLFNMVLSSWNQIIYFEGFNDPRVKKGNEALQRLRERLDNEGLLID